MIQHNYIEKTYAGWLGKIIGIRLGSPIEGWTYDQISKIYGDIDGYLVDYQDYAADDDSNGPLFFVRALKDYSYKIGEITEKEMGYTWLNYAPENHGFFWWGGYGISTEHTAYNNIKHGIDAPRSGSIEQNGLACAEQIGGQIFSDCWGFIAPGEPQLAAEYAAKMARVSHDGEGVNGARFVAGCISAAYNGSSLMDIIEVGLSLIPEESEYYFMAKSVIGYYTSDSEKDWRKCFKYIQENFGYDKYPGSCHIIPNAAVMILSMLYGDESFSKTLCICNMCGWDTDCNAGNIGSILGVFVGIEHIEDKWIRPVNDLLLSSSVIGGLNITTVAQSIELFCGLGYKIAGVEPPKDWKDILYQDNYFLHFNLPKSNQAMRIKSSNKSAEITIKNVQVEERRCLRITANRLQSDTEVIVYHKTYYQPDDLHDSRYDPAFTPILYPGQTVKTALYNRSGFTLYARIYIQDLNHNKMIYSDIYQLTDEWTELEFHIPDLKDCLIKEAGIIINKNADTKINDKVLNVDMKYFGFSGSPSYNINFAEERIENYGFGHSTLHKEISQFTCKNGLWELDKEYLSGSCCDEGEAYTGYYNHKNYTYECTLNPQTGNYHLMLFRVQGGVRSYAFGFYGKDTIALVKKHKYFSILEKKAYQLDYKKDYRLKITVNNDLITAYINGQRMFEIEDNSYLHGQIGLGVLEGSHCHFKEVTVLNED